MSRKRQEYPEGNVNFVFWLAVLAFMGMLTFAFMDGSWVAGEILMGCIATTAMLIAIFDQEWK